MEMLTGDSPLIHEWKARGMEGDGYEGEAEAGSHRQDHLLQLFRQRDTRHRRTARFYAILLLLLIVAVLALVIVAGVERQCHAVTDSQTKVQADSHSSGIAGKQEQVGIPRALLTAPLGDNTAGKYLQWETTKGNAYCEGNFTYNSPGGELVVPRDGYYRVYLQLTYELYTDYCENCTETVMKLTNSVFYIGDSYQGDRLLMSSEDTVVSGRHPWSKSLYTAVTFKLKANSRLHVTSSCRQFLSKNEFLVFFGAELLPE
ncbi:lymphotoxin-alpha-like [Odontesthes bonariensis]|uniref:lymphotoxin-alpha-like n=1 Tax=Odontesthes bonariensis TaxID=219752 RepID=UPI003F58E6CE